MAATLRLRLSAVQRSLNTEEGSSSIVVWLCKKKKSPHTTMAREALAAVGTSVTCREQSDEKKNLLLTQNPEDPAQKDGSHMTFFFF